MNECLITQLKASVSDDALLKLGEFRFKVVPYSNDDALENINIVPIPDIYLGIKALEGFFIDSDKNNIGTYKEVTSKDFYMMASSGAILSISDKYKIREFKIGTSKGKPAVELNLSVFSGIYDLEWVQLTKHCSVSGDISAFAEMKNLQRVSLVNQKSVTGDISVFANKPNLTILDLTQCLGIYGNLNSLKSSNIIRLIVSGTSVDISLNDIPESVSYLSAYNTALEDDISVLSTLPNIRTFDATGCNMYGNISNLDIPSTMTSINVINNERITGDAEDFFNRQIGRISSGGSLTLYAKGTSVRYNGSLVMKGLKATYTGVSYSIVEV